MNWRANAGHDLGLSKTDFELLPCSGPVLVYMVGLVPSSKPVFNPGLRFRPVVSRLHEIP